MINFNNFGKKYVWKTVAVVGVLALMLAGQVSEAKGPKGKGPRASVLSATECALVDDAFLEVTTTLTNKSSGNTVPEVRDGSMIQGTFKDRPGRAFEILGTVLIAAPQDVDPELTLTAEFPLCNDDGTVRDEVVGARELNGLSTIMYGISGGEGETRVVTNRCTDDPETEDVNEGGIKVADVFDDIEAACAP